MNEMILFSNFVDAINGRYANLDALNYFGCGGLAALVCKQDCEV